MNQYCRLCACYRAQHQFSGKGRRAHLCRDCIKLPAQERADRLAMMEVHGFVWGQRNISTKNIKRLTKLVDSNNAEVAELAAVVLQIATVAPGRRRRLARIQEAQPLLWERMLAINLVLRDEEYDGEIGERNSPDLDEDDELAFDCDVTGVLTDDGAVDFRPQKPPNDDDCDIRF